MVDTELIRPYLLEYLSQNQLKTLAEKSEVNAETIQKIIYQKQTKVQFDTADRLVCAIGYGGLFWNSQDMKDIYKKINLRYIDKTKPIQMNSPEYATTVETGQLLPAN